MQSFEDLGLAPEWVEALAGEGMEGPTPLQEEALPVIRKGASVVLGAGPGAGILLAWAVPLLERIEPGEGEPRILVLTSSRDAADALAGALARVAGTSGHTVAALGSRWVLAERADVLFGTPADVNDATSAGRVRLEGVQAVVLDGLAAFEGTGSLSLARTILEAVPAEAQRIAITLPLTEAGRSFVEGSIRRAIFIPPRSVEAAAAAAVPHRGELRYRLVRGEKEDAVLAAVGDLLDGGEHHHVLLFCRSDDAAADLGDFLTLHGYLAGEAGDAEAPVWLAVDEMEGRAAIRGALDPSVVASLSADVPFGPDSLDRRHGSGASGATLIFPRELPHLREVATQAGYQLHGWPVPTASPLKDAAENLRSRLLAALKDEDLTLHFPVIEPLLREHDPLELAVAAISLLRRGGGAVEGSTVVSEGAATRGPAPAWVRIFLSVGEKDGVGPGDLVGAVAGEAGVRGNQIGKIEIRDTFSRIEVEDSVAPKVLKALNGITIRGRAVRADYDRGTGRLPQEDSRGRSGGAPQRGGGAPPRGGGPRTPGGGSRGGFSGGPRGGSGGPRGGSSSGGGGAPRPGGGGKPPFRRGGGESGRS